MNNMESLSFSKVELFLWRLNRFNLPTNYGVTVMDLLIVGLGVEC